MAATLDCCAQSREDFRISGRGRDLPASVGKKPGGCFSDPREAPVINTVFIMLYLLILCGGNRFEAAQLNAICCGQISQ